MARLVELLTNELQEWPHDPEYNEILCITQDPDGATYTWEYPDPVYGERETWVHPRDLPVEDINIHGIATDHATAIVTREMWEAERARIAAPQPDWSKAPEGATHLIDDGCGDIRWYDLSGKPYLVMFSESEGWTKSANGRFDTEWMSELIPRPTIPLWNGEGLPPAGVVCEVYNRSLGEPEFERCTILFAGKHRYVYDSESCYERSALVGELSFRPICTPREKWIEAAHAEGCPTNIAALLFDAGLAKLPD